MVSEQEEYEKLKTDEERAIYLVEAWQHQYREASQDPRRWFAKGNIVYRRSGFHLIKCDIPIYKVIGAKVWKTKVCDDFELDECPGSDGIEDSLSDDSEDDTKGRPPPAEKKEKKKAVKKKVSLCSFLIVPGPSAAEICDV
jgi:hypothetical protein